MARTTIYNDNLTENWQAVNEKNKQLLKEFIRYCVANNKSPKTCGQYEAQLKIFFCWNEKENNNLFFIDVKKRHFINFFGWGREIGWSSCRLASLRAALSSFSNFIERILDEDYPNFRNLVKVLEPIHTEAVREKTVLTDEEVYGGIEKLAEMKEYQLACFMALLVSSGMRKSEVGQMKVKYFTTEKQIIWNGLAYKTPKLRTKGKGVEGKQISRYVFRANFDKYLELWLAERERLKITLPELFVVKSGKGDYAPAKTESFTNWCNKIGQLLGIESFYAHSARHFFTTSLKKKGWTSDVIQKTMEWSSADLVNVYVDISKEDELSEFMAKLAPDGTYVESLEERLKK